METNSIQGARFFVADESPSYGNLSPTSLGGTIEDPFGHCWLIGRHWTGRTK